MYHITSCHLPLDATPSDQKKAISRILTVSPDDIQSYQITKQSLDARKKQELHYVYAFDVELKAGKRPKRLAKQVTQTESYRYQEPLSGTQAMSQRPVVIGFGPAGMLCALQLARRGYAPIVYERGSDVDTRACHVESYWNKGSFLCSSNVQFGEGGAGTFSDGKLTTRIKDKRIHKVLDELVAMGADASIRYLAHPHIGTDRLRVLVKNLRTEIERLGGEVHFGCHLDDIAIAHDRIEAISINGNWQPCETLVLAIGHSAADTFTMLHTRDVPMQAKPFAIGVRIEHLQDTIDRIQWKEAYGNPLLPPAEYHVTHTASNGKGVYSFCMCPGGIVVASNSTEHSIVTNGMSYSGRDLTNANSAILVQVDASDYGNDLFDGLHYQQALEHQAWLVGGSNNKAPCQLAKHYLGWTDDNVIGKVQPSYPLGVTMTDLHPLFSPAIKAALQEGLRHFEAIMPGFINDDALLTAVESRSSSPLRILRDPITLQSDVSGIYPAGEGAGYAGGIVSSAIDGLKCAEQIIMRYRPL